MSEENYKFKLKVQKDFPEFSDSMNSMNVEEIEKTLSRYAKYREETILAKKEDLALKRAQEVAKELAAPFSETLKALTAKTAYLNLLIDEKNGGS